MPGQVKGYWSFDEEPGNPKWPPSHRAPAPGQPDGPEWAPGPEWAWVHEEVGLSFVTGRQEIAS